MGNGVTVTVIGGRATLRELRSLDTNLYWECINEMKRAIKPLRAAIDANFPSGPPLSGFDHEGRTGWRQRKRTDSKVGGRRKANGEWPLARVVVVDAPRQIFDLADSGTLGANLRAAGWGSPSRAVWATDAQMRAQVSRDVLDALDRGSRKANTRLRKVR